jgi:hypothetical protein
MSAVNLCREFVSLAVLMGVFTRSTPALEAE